MGAGAETDAVRVWADVCPNTTLETVGRLVQQRQQRVQKFPKDVRVFNKAVALRQSLRDGLHSLPELR